MTSALLNMVPKREYNLRPRLNRLPRPTLSNLATCALDRLRLDPHREQDGLGRRDELLHLASVAPAPAPELAPAPTLFDNTRSLQLVSHDGYLLAYRSWGPPPATSEAFNRFVARWNEAERMTKLSSGPGDRGGHRQTLELHLTVTHKLAPALAEALVNSPALDILSCTRAS
ncbi:hypothetical protein JCM3775_006502 [Rhodotorula graminis]